MVQVGKVYRWKAQIWMWTGCRPEGCGPVEGGLARGQAEPWGLRRWGALHAVQATVDARGDGFDLRGQLLLHTVQVVAIVEGDQVDGKTQVPESARATNAVQVPADRHKWDGLFE